MAIISELGRNSAVITYGPSNTGSDVFGTFGLVDKWIRNDTLQGSASTSGTTVLGVNSMFLTQLKVGDLIMLGGYKREVASIASDSSFTVTSTFAPNDISAATPGSIKVLNPVIGTSPQNTQLAGTASTISASSANSNTAGLVSVKAGDNVVTGNGLTYFLSECTNSVTTTALTGTVAVGTDGVIAGNNTLFLTAALDADRLKPGDSILVGTGDYFIVNTVTSDTGATVRVPPGSAINAGAAIAKAANSVVGRYININGRIRRIDTITNDNVLAVNAPFDFTDTNLQFELLPRGTVAVTAGNATITGTNTCFSWDIPSGSQAWIGDELRTITYTAGATTSATAGTPTGYSGIAAVFLTALSGLTFRRDDTVVTYTPSGGTLLANEIRVGDDIIINGNETTVTKIISTTQFKVSNDLPYFDGKTVYKKKKMHGFLLEGTREGTTSNTATTKFSNLTYVTGTALAGTNTVSLTGLTANVHVVNNFVKIQGAGGPHVALSGTVKVSVNNTIVGDNTSFTTELHVGAEVCIGNQFGYISAISSNTGATITPWTGAAINTGPTNSFPIYRTTPLYTYITATTLTSLTLYHPLKNSVYVNGTSGAAIMCPTNAASEYIEYVYSAPNKMIETSITDLNNSYDRKYFGIRYYPMAGSTATIPGSDGAYNVTVYERWVASWSGCGGVGINMAHGSNLTTGLGVVTQTNTVTDQTTMTFQTGGYLYLFAKPRYFLVQGKTFGGIQKQWLGCLEFERAQPDDASAGLGTATSGFSYTGTFSGSYTSNPTISPFPCFAYFNSNRFPVGATQVPTFPVDYTSAAQGVHGSIFSVPRIKGSRGDLVGINSHIYTAATVTTGRWGHLLEIGGNGAYTNPTAVTPIVPTTGIVMAPNTLFQPHLGQIIPFAPNVYNSKRFMFSPVVILGPAWDPDIRGRIYGLKIIPSNLGTLMDTVNVTIESDDFYDKNGTATDHWVVTAPGVVTYTFRVIATATATSGVRSLEDESTTLNLTPATFTNNFRFAIPT